MRNQLLRDSDWAGMAHGVEIRVPFADVTVIRTLAPLLAGRNPPTKAQLAHAVAHPLTEAIAARRKTGFSVPVRDWLREDAPNLSGERGLRGWSRVIRRIKGGHRFLAFITDGFGGHGGIALYNRDLLQALCSNPACAGGVAIPRHMPNPPEAMPRKLSYIDSAVGGKLRYRPETGVRTGLPSSPTGWSRSATSPRRSFVPGPPPAPSNCWCCRTRSTTNGMAPAPKIRPCCGVTGSKAKPCS